MEIFYYIFAALLIVSTFIPLIPNQHWFFRVFDFAKVQIFILQFLLVLFGFLFIIKSNLFFVSQLLLIGCMIYEISLLYKYTPFYKVEKHIKTNKASKTVTLISANVFQFNREYQKFIHYVQKQNPDIILTMESNGDWENAMQVFKKDYAYFVEVGLENTYGIHLYSKIEITKSNVHYFVADDIPSIEALMKTKDGFEFIFFGVHPPPPSPTEEETSKERDGELLAVAKKIRSNKYSSIVVGDFNNVAWAKSSVLFRKTSEMIDPRIGRGLISTFHAKYWFLRFPIDQMFHSSDVFVEKLEAQDNFGSDHLPLFCAFYIDKKNDIQEDLIEQLEKDEMKEVNEMIKEGKQEDGERETVVTE
ncbi:endonuclease/exonuclease/phosphatase family protein [Paenimyroides tangerinum]|uniref:Endonuclease/exonuclease/phosphatase family protein n=1 Tax=Paenimyroides tangerinum TaxID=2488728 RepID=A0A3P3VZC8_9FLAO|nr:endonuclease/exonuclease/phosphatase family protein [Paenimyroides tangerinum]RRJ88145.1 endonuclease/exonuclease/phosphatase family protein [Paenimyroides tangerinum]